MSSENLENKQLRFASLEQAIKEAKSMTKALPEVYVNIILSNNDYYVETGDSFIRNWETLLKTYLNGKIVKR